MALAIDRALTVLRDPEPVRIHIGPAVRDEAHAVLVDEVVRGLGSIRQMVNVLHAVDEVRERLAWHRVDLAQMKDRLDLAVVDLAASVVVAIAFSV